MSDEYVIPDVPVEIALHVSRMINLSSTSLSKDSIVQGMDGIAKLSYVERGLKLSQQFEMIESVLDKSFKGTNKFKEDFLKLHISDFPILARKALQDYPPFLSYIENIKMGYSSTQSARIVAGIFGLDNGIAEKFLQRSGLYCGLLSNDGGIIKLTKSDPQNIDYVTNLQNSLNSDLAAKNLISLLLSNEVVTYFSKKGIDFNRPAKALTEIKSDPKASLYKIFEFAESCLYAFGKDIGANVQNANGIAELVDSIRTQKAILVNPTNLGKGLGGMRNMANHGPDKDTGKSWTFTEETVLGTSLLIFRYIRSIYLSKNHGLQEI